MEQIRYFWIWLTSRMPHRCGNWQHFLGNEKGGVIFCSVCGKILDEKKAAND